MRSFLDSKAVKKIVTSSETYMPKKLVFMKSEKLVRPKNVSRNHWIYPIILKYVISLYKHNNLPISKALDTVLFTPAEMAFLL